jgi:hypothetical protein
MTKARRPTMDALWATATRHPRVEAGVACAGTALECRTAKVGGKAFLFLRQEDARFKLGVSAKEASRPGSGCKVGAGGWCHVLLAGEDAPPLDVMQRWIAESYALMAASATAKRKPKKPAR